ncbi:MAG: hypothetical protein NC095_07720 [Muribaculum sp.]|nr:hypothetical protein [Muribaculum sp.]
MKTNQIESVKSRMLDFLPEMALGVLSLSFPVALAFNSFIGTTLSVAAAAIAALSIDYDKYEKGGEQ